MELLWFALIGLAAGWLANQLSRGGGGGLIGTLALGVVGAVFGGWLFRQLGLAPTSLLGALLTATAGAIVVLWIVRLVTPRRQKR
jgi:uncharacterized membrane protein YeaQ/YmgE (transglycosylase-associated protein family)